MRFDLDVHVFSVFLPILFLEACLSLVYRFILGFVSWFSDWQSCECTMADH